MKINCFIISFIISNALALTLHANLWTGNSCTVEDDPTFRTLRGVESHLNGIVDSRPQAQMPPFIEKSTVYILTTCADGRPANCSGVIVGKNRILSADHCFLCLKGNLDASRVKVCYGRDKDSAVCTTGKGKISTHGSEDLAFFKVPSIPEGFNPIPIYPTENKVKSGRKVVVAGFGLTNKRDYTSYGKLNWGEMVYEREEPVQVYDRGNVIYKNLKTLTNSFNKAAPDGSMLLSGDSGGPTFIQENGKWYLFGITSGGLYRKGQKSDGDVSDPSRNRAWILGKGPRPPENQPNGPKMAGNWTVTKKFQNGYEREEEYKIVQNGDHIEVLFPKLYTSNTYSGKVNSAGKVKITNSSNTVIMEGTLSKDGKTLQGSTINISRTCHEDVCKDNKHTSTFIMRRD